MNLPHVESVYRESARGILLFAAEQLQDEDSALACNPRDLSLLIYAATQLEECAVIAEKEEREAEVARETVRLASVLQKATK